MSHIHIFSFEIMAFTIIGVSTALLPKSFINTAPASILSELRPNIVEQFQEHSERERSLHLRRIPCITVDTHDSFPWILAEPLGNWQVIFASETVVYGTKYWVDYEPQGLLEYLRVRAPKYNLIYQREQVPIFTIQVSQFQESGTWYVRMTTKWCSVEIDRYANQIDISTIFTNHNECAVCLDTALLAQWPGCTHSFCHDCISQWMATNATCPLCRAPA